MKILLIKSCRENLFLKVYFYLNKKYGDIDVLAKKDTSLEFGNTVKFKYENSKLSTCLLQSELKNMRNIKFDQVFFVVPNGVLNLYEYKNVYSFSRYLEPKNIYFTDIFCNEHQVKSWFHFYYLIFSAGLFRHTMKFVLFSGCLFFRLLKRLTPGVTIERNRL